MNYLTGSCLCGRVKIRIPDRFDRIGNCHCSECRKFSGSAFASAGAVDYDDFKILQGEEFIRYYPKTEDTDLGFCSECGSSLFSKKSHLQKYLVRLGILDDAPTQKPNFHIYVGSKAPWFEICDELAQFEETPPVAK